MCETSVTPEELFDGTDPGDDTLRRYRYQATYAAVLAVGMLVSSKGIKEVYCELRDDILLSMEAGDYIAVQVKTQKNGDPWKTNDEQIGRALDKFASYENAFPNSFRRHILATNHLFYKVKDNGRSLDFIVNCARNEVDNPKFLKFSKQVAKRTGFDVSVVIKMLTKLYLDDSLPKLTRINRELRDIIQIVSSNCEYATIPELDRIVRSLSLTAYYASSLNDPPPTAAYILIAENPEDEDLNNKVDSKRITRDIVEQAIQDNLIPSASLTSANLIENGKIPSDLNRLEKKLTAGGLSMTTIYSAEDWYASAEYQYRKWAGKLGEECARDRFNHIATIAQTECQTAYEEVRDEEKPFGRAMMATLQEGVKNRLIDVNTELFDCKYEHLLGHAAIRTNMCKVWWSKEFDLDEEGNDED